MSTPAPAPTSDDEKQPLPPPVSPTYPRRLRTPEQLAEYKRIILNVDLYEEEAYYNIFLDSVEQQLATSTLPIIFSPEMYGEMDTTGRAFSRVVKEVEKQYQCHVVGQGRYRGLEIESLKKPKVSQCDLCHADAEVYECLDEDNSRLWQCLSCCDIMCYGKGATVRMIGRPAEKMMSSSTPEERDDPEAIAELAEMLKKVQDYWGSLKAEKEAEKKKKVLPSMNHCDVCQDPEAYECDDSNHKWSWKCISCYDKQVQKKCGYVRMLGCPNEKMIEYYEKKGYKVLDQAEKAPRVRLGKKVYKCDIQEMD